MSQETRTEGRSAAIAAMKTLPNWSAFQPRADRDTTIRTGRRRRGTRRTRERPEASRSVHQGSGSSMRPAASSITCPAANSVSSSKARPMSCRPSGRPCASRPAGTAMPGRPAMFTVTVKMSFRYISTGSAAPFSPIAKAADGVAGVRIASTPLGVDLLEVALDEGADFLGAHVVGVVVAGREHVGADHDAALDLAPEALGAGFLVHVDDIPARHAQAVADAVVAGEVRGGLGRRHDVVGRQRIFRVRQRDVDDLGPGRAQPFGAPHARGARFRPACRRGGIPSECRSAGPSRRAPAAAS